jgi:RND family efflux transporter MFP subunit
MQQKKRKFEGTGMKSSLQHIMAIALLTVFAGVPAIAQQPAGSASGESGKPAEQRLDLRAQLTASRYTTLSSEIGAKINLIAFREGNAFTAGQILLAFDCTLLEAQLQKAQAELASAEHTYKANKELLRLNAVGQLELDVSEAALLRNQADANANTALVSKCVIKAPFSGRIADQKVREQQYVQSGQALLEILDDSALELEFLVPSRWLNWMKIGGNLRVTIDETRKTYPARFVRIGARVDPVSQSVKVAASISGRHPELVVGMSGQVHVSTK